MYKYKKGTEIAAKRKKSPFLYSLIRFCAIYIPGIKILITITKYTKTKKKA